VLEVLLPQVAAATAATVLTAQLVLLTQAVAVVVQVV
jgi:hypothetical protein